MKGIKDLRSFKGHPLVQLQGKGFLVEFRHSHDRPSQVVDIWMYFMSEIMSFFHPFNTPHHQHTNNL